MIFVVVGRIPDFNALKYMFDENSFNTMEFLEFLICA